MLSWQVANAIKAQIVYIYAVYVSLYLLEIIYWLLCYFGIEIWDKRDESLETGWCYQWCEDSTNISWNLSSSEAVCATARHWSFDWSLLPSFHCTSAEKQSPGRQEELHKAEDIHLMWLSFLISFFHKIAHIKRGTKKGWSVWRERTTAATWASLNVPIEAWQMPEKTNSEPVLLTVSSPTTNVLDGSAGVEGLSTGTYIHAGLVLLIPVPLFGYEAPLGCALHLVLYSTSVSDWQESWLNYSERERDAVDVLPLLRPLIPLLWPLTPLYSHSVCTSGCIFRPSGSEIPTAVTVIHLLGLLPVREAQHVALLCSQQLDSNSVFDHNLKSPIRQRSL